jgi:hypothetical protein
MAARPPGGKQKAAKGIRNESREPIATSRQPSGVSHQERRYPSHPDDSCRLMAES